MKKTLIYLCALSLLTGILSGCKKNSASKPKEFLLSKVYRNGKLESFQEYNDKNQLSTFTEYNLTTGLVSYSSTFMYDKLGLKSVNSFDSKGNPTGIEKLTRDLTGLTTLSEFIGVSGSDSGKVITRVSYSWDKNGMLAKQSWLDLVTGKPYGYRKLTWYDNGNIKSSEYYGSVNPDVLWWKTEYSPAGNPVPEQIAGHSGYLVNYNNFYFVSEEISQTTMPIAGGPQDYIEKMSKRKYNEQGLLSEQTISTNYINPVQLSPLVTKKYEYIERESQH